MQASKRYTLLKVFLVVLAVNLLLFIVGFLVITFLQTSEFKDNNRRMLTATYLGKELFGLIFQTIFYYFSLNYFNRLMLKKSRAFYYIRAALLMFIVCFGYYAARHFLFPENAADDKAIPQPAIFIFSYSVSSIFFTGVSLLLAYLNNLRDEKKERKILEAQKMQLEVDKSQANFKFLKSQINPHFLHNTLNFLYAKSLPYSAELSEGILTLSDIMRYALNESTGADDKAPLKDEIEHVRNVIKINQLRFSNNLHVNFEVNGVLNGAQIIPFVLITIVENAFKHGDLQRPEHPIEIKLEVDHDRLYFYCRNKKKSGPKEISTGLGLDNIRNRLDFAYGSNYKLQIKDEADFYTTELTIDKL
ncbi:MAG: histidine kinase [Chitinophagaceae bacterium]|nr:histidine kinase [Chitinophagaceae bacterium]